MPETAQNFDGRVNVIASSGAAGGLVGSAAGTLALTQSYAATSTYGSTASGGLIGSAGTTSIGNCYALGTVFAPDGTSKDVKGVFVGTGSTPTFSGVNRYLESTNDLEDMNAIGIPTVATDTLPADSVTGPADANTATYVAFSGNSSTAYPYDDSLIEWYNDTYPYKTIAELASLSSSVTDKLVHLKMHYGDWPSIETFIINATS